MQLDRGYITPYMVTDTEKMEAVLDDALILLTDKKISSIQDLLPILEQVAQSRWWSQWPCGSGPPGRRWRRRSPRRPR